MSYRINTYASIIMWAILCMISIPMMLIVMKSTTVIIEWQLMSYGPSIINLPLIIDPLGLMFCSTVLLISANVLSFSSSYMKEDPFINRFTLLVLAFIASMNLLIYIPHLMALLLGWDGLGLVSFILVVYYQNQKSLSAGMITALTNRIGDALLLVGIAITVNQGHWMITNMSHSPLMFIQIMLILVAAMTKSAQMPFSSWLPAAMAAPTPVSALVHSSTLVTAGVFLLIRFYNFLHSVPLFNHILLIIATMTMFMAGLSATTECDMKKIIALSTLSQLGLMMFSLGLNNPTLATFHMITHALFKALLFICAGSMINFHMHSQELRWMGNIPSQMPIISSCFAIANMALCGFPFMAGFYSKDMIMEWMTSNNMNMIIFMIATMSVGVTAFYTIRFTLSVITSMNMCSPHLSINEPMNIAMPVMIMGLASTVAGAMLSWLLSPNSSYFLLPLSLKITPTLMMLMGMIMGLILIPTNKITHCSLTKSIMNHYASAMMWYLVPISSQFPMYTSMSNMHKTLYNIDHGWMESPQMSFNSVNALSVTMMNTIPLHPSTVMSTGALLMSITIVSTMLVW